MEARVFVNIVGITLDDVPSINSPLLTALARVLGASRVTKPTVIDGTRFLGFRFPTYFHVVKADEVRAKIREYVNKSKYAALEIETHEGVYEFRVFEKPDAVRDHLEANGMLRPGGGGGSGATLDTRALQESISAAVSLVRTY